MKCEDVCSVQVVYIKISTGLQVRIHPLLETVTVDGDYFLISKVGVLALHLLNHPDLEVICGVFQDVKIGIYWFS